MTLNWFPAFPRAGLQQKLSPLELKLAAFPRNLVWVCIWDHPEHWQSLILVYTQKQHKPPAQLRSLLNLSNTSLKWNLPGITGLGLDDPCGILPTQDILCPTCLRLPAQEDQAIITTPKAFVGFLAGWGGKLCCSHQASQGTAGTQSWGELPASQSWAGREGTFLQHSQPETPQFSSRNIQGTPEQSQISWRRVPAGNHSCPCSGSHSLAGKWLFPKSPCSSTTCTWRFWSPHPWNFSRLDHPALAEGVGLDDGLRSF